MFNKLYLIEATIKDSYNEIRKRLKDFYKDNPKNKDRVKDIVTTIATEVLGEDYWQFITETGLDTFVSDAIVDGGAFPLKLYWVDTLYNKYISQGKPNIDKEQTKKAIGLWEKSKWEYFTKQNIDEYFSEPQLYDKKIVDIAYAITAWEWLHDSHKARQYFSKEFVNDKALINSIFFNGKNLRASTEIEDELDEWETEYGADTKSKRSSDWDDDEEKGNTKFGTLLKAFGLTLSQVLEDFEDYVKAYPKEDKTLERRGGYSQKDSDKIDDVVASQERMNRLNDYMVVAPRRTNRTDLAKFIVDTVLRFLDEKR